MAVIGVQHAVASPITKYNDGAMPTYGEGFIVSRLTKIDDSLEYNDTSAYSDNSIEETDKSFSKGSLTFGTYGLGKTIQERYEVRAKLFGETVTEDKELITGAKDISQHLGYGYIKTERSSNVDYYIARWYYDVQFAPPSESIETRGESISFQTQDIQGTVYKIDNWGNDNIKKEKLFNTYKEAETWLDTIANLVNSTGSSS